MTDPNQRDCPKCRGPLAWKYLREPLCPQCDADKFPAGYLNDIQRKGPGPTVLDGHYPDTAMQVFQDVEGTVPAKPGDPVSLVVTPYPFADHSTDVEEAAVKAFNAYIARYGVLNTQRGLVFDFWMEGFKRGRVEGAPSTADIELSAAKARIAELEKAVQGGKAYAHAVITQGGAIDYIVAVPCEAVDPEGAAKQMCRNHIEAAIFADIEGAETLVIRPLYTHPAESREEIQAQALEGQADRLEHICQSFTREYQQGYVSAARELRNEAARLRGDKGME